MKYLVGFFFVFCLIGCSETPKELPYDQYRAWIALEQHGLVKERDVNNIKISARYLPSEYLAHREYRGVTAATSFDSLYAAYKCGLYFQLSLEADKSDKRYGNLMSYNVFSNEDMMERTRFLSFRIAEFVTLQYGDNHLEPVLSHFEGYDQLGNKLNFLVAFASPDKDCEANLLTEDVRLTFDDPIWNMGTNNFEFSKDAIRIVPKVRM